MKTALDNARGRLRQLESCKSSLQAEVQKQMESTERALTSVSENQELIDKHLANSTRYKQELDNCLRKYRLAVEECGVFSDKVDGLEKQLREKERMLREQESSWQREREKLKESLQSKTNEVNCLQKAKEALDESNHQLTLNNQKLSHSVEEAEALLNVSKSDVSVQMGPSLYLMIDLGVQVCPEVRSEAVQFRPPTHQSYSQTAPPQNPSKLTQTVPALTPPIGGVHAVAVQTMRTVVVSKGCGQGDAMTEVKDIGSQTTIVSKVAFLKPAGHTSKRDDTTVVTMNHPMKANAVERNSAIVKTEKVDGTSKPMTSLAGGGGVEDTTTDKAQEEQDPTVKSQSILHKLLECNNDGAVNSMATQLKARHKGILKAPVDIRGKKTVSKSVNFPDKLETRIMIPSTTDPNFKPKRTPYSHPKLKKPPLQMLTSHGNTLNIKQETVEDLHSDGHCDAPACPIPSDERPNPVSILCSDVKDAFSDLENSAIDGFRARENVTHPTTTVKARLGVSLEEVQDQETEDDNNAPSCKKQKRL